jgi:hypothetical protein
MSVKVATSIVFVGRRPMCRTIDSCNDPPAFRKASLIEAFFMSVKVATSIVFVGRIFYFNL